MDKPTTPLADRIRIYERAGIGARKQDAMVQEFRDIHINHQPTNRPQQQQSSRSAHRSSRSSANHEEEWINPVLIKHSRPTANQQWINPVATANHRREEEEWINPRVTSTMAHQEAWINSSPPNHSREDVAWSTNHSRASGHVSNQGMDEEGLILPKKLVNPCLESREVQDLNKQIKWNAKAGVNVLGNKSELEKALARRKAQRVDEARKREDSESKSDFQKVLEERAKKIDHILESSSPPSKDATSCTIPSTTTTKLSPNPSSSSQGNNGDSGHCSPEPESEFLKVHAQLKGGARTRACT